MVYYRSMQTLRQRFATLTFVLVALLLALAVWVRDGNLGAWRYIVELLDLRIDDCRTLTAALWRGQSWALHEEAVSGELGVDGAPFAEEALRFETIWRRLWVARAMDTSI